MVYKERILCDQCGEEMPRNKKGFYDCNGITVIVHKNIAKRLDLKGIMVSRHRVKRKFRELTLDLCSKQCLIAFLEKVRDTEPLMGSD